MKLKLHSIFVDNQETALKFYTEILGFTKKMDIPVDDYRWLTVISPEDPEGVEIVLEPSDNPATKVFKEELFTQKIPFTALLVENIDEEYKRLKGLGVEFIVEPTDSGTVKIALFDDTCGNLIQIYQEISLT